MNFFFFFPLFGLPTQLLVANAKEWANRLANIENRERKAGRRTRGKVAGREQQE